MARVALEVTDAGLVAARGDQVRPAVPGVALLDPEGVVTGAEAAAQARLRPVFAFDRHWSELSTDPLPRQVPGARSRADLAFHQLKSLWADIAAGEDELLLVVPSTMRPPQLGLLAGIAAAAGIPVTGCVDMAVAACASLDAAETVLHLDVQLHQAVLTELRGAKLLRRQRVELAWRVGLRALQSAWAQLIAEALVRRTRFDPLHKAATEQQLFDRLPGWLDQLADQDEVEVGFETGAGRFGVTLQREQFILAAEAYYAQLADLVRSLARVGEPTTLVLSARAGALPSLAVHLAGLVSADVAVLGEGAAARAACDLQIVAGEGGSLSLLTALPRARPCRETAGTGGN